MANPIQKNDLISDEALKALEEMSRLLREDKENMDALMASFKQYAGSIQPAVAANNNNNDALTAALQKVSELEKSYSDLQKLMKENAATQKAVASEKRKYAKLTADEAESVKRLSENIETYIRLTNSQTQSLKGLAEVYGKNIVEIDIQKKSYNELYQTYNALKDALNKMTVEERLNTEAGKKLTEQSLKIRDTLNELQKSTGNYTLQVGKYSAAFDGLGYSFQQILREAPSALNLNQFFLAISNNIPQFLDQLKAFNAEQKAIKDNLANMTEGTKEYAEEIGKVMSVGQKLSKTILSWQTGVLVLLMVLRNLPKIIEWFKKLTGATKDWFNALNEARKEQARIMSSVESTLMQTRSELELIINDLKGTTQGTVEWKNAIARVNEITKANLNDTTATIREVEKVTNAYLEQQKQLEINKKVAEAYAKQQLKEYAMKNMFMPGSDWETLLDWTGMSDDKIKQLKELFSKQQKKIDEAIATGADYIPSLYDALLSDGKGVGHDNALKIWTTYGENVSASGQRLRQMYNDLYKSMPAGSGSGSGGSKPSEKDITDRYWEAERALLNAMEEGMQKEIEISDWERRKNKDEQDKWYAEQLAALEENVKNGFTTREQADKEALELKRQYNALQEDEDRQHNERVVKIQMDAYRKQLAIREELHKKEMQAIVETSKADTVHVQRRVRNATQEANKNAALATNIEHLVEARKKLLAVEIAMDENKSIEERIKLLEQLNKQIERYASQISITQKIRQYGSVSDMLGTFIGGRVGGQGKENLISNILGEDAMKARIAGFQADNPDGWEKDYMDWLDGEFEEWGKQAMSAASTWYSTTMGYINDLISAYVELANAKAEAAAEATEAAQEEYDKEKALLEAGYASRVEATWAEYQEKKAAQEKAEADAKAAAKAQQQLNEAEAMGSLIVASANIWKTFSAIKGFGVPLALAALATMWGSFIQAKVKAAEVSKYGEGGFEVLEGGSHASGHDIDLGVKNRKGRRMKAEGKEGIGIFSRRAMSHYGANNIEAMVNSVNRLEFEGNAAKRMSLERSVGLQVLSMPRTDLHRVESDLHKLVSYGSRNVTVLPDGTIREVRKNGVVTIKKG